MTEIPATDPLEGCRKKIERAAEHLNSLKTQVEEWGKTSPYEIKRELDEKSGDCVLRVRGIRSAPLIQWGLVLGDVVHNLRSALDHLVCVLARQANPSDDCRGTAFPVLLKEQHWDEGRLRGADDWARRTIKSLQPFSPGKQQGEGHPLWILHDLDIIDKHRTVHLSQFFHYVPEITFDPPGSGEVISAHQGGPLEVGSELLRYRLKPEARDVKTNTHYGADIVLAEGSGAATGMNIFALLPWVRDYVEWVIDLFGYKYFGGPEPAGHQRTVVKATRSVSVSQRDKSSSVESEGGDNG